MNQSANQATIQFLRGTDETTVPEIRLTRSRDGRTGQAFFTFEDPEALSFVKDGSIKGMSMIDEEGELVTREVSARFVNGSPNALEAKYIWRSKSDFDRFMRFAERYAKSHGLGYSDKT